MLGWKTVFEQEKWVVIAKIGGVGWCWIKYAWSEIMVLGVVGLCWMVLGGVGWCLGFSITHKGDTALQTQFDPSHLKNEKSL